jgi:hypothetical protein
LTTASKDDDRDEPVSLYPPSREDALRALLQTKPDEEPVNGDNGVDHETEGGAPSEEVK